MERRQLVIDGTAFDDLDGFFAEMDRLLTDGKSSRRTTNLNALNDLLRGGFGAHSYGEKLAITWRNAAKSRRDLGYPATVERLRTVLERCHPLARPEIMQMLDDAKQDVGDTLFDTIVQIITDTDGSGHDCTLTLED